MKKPLFTGSGVALVTPHKADGSINYEVLHELIEFQLQNHTDAILACVTTSESSTMNHEEHTDALRFIINTVNHRVPVIAGAGSNDTAYAVELSIAAREAGADALLSVTPYYNKTSQAGLVRHFNHIADYADLPIMLYNVPSRTGCNIKPETYLELSKHPNIVATKEANGDISSVAKTIALCGDELQVYSGNDDQVLPMLVLGAQGVVSVLANILPKLMHDICADYFAGNLESARKAFLRHVELMSDGMFMDVNPIPVKEAMNLMGFDVGECRLPLVSMTEANKARLAALLRKYNLLSNTSIGG